MTAKDAISLAGQQFNLNNPESLFVNGDCMDYLPLFPDGYFDLAIVDPPYFGVKQGGYMQNNDSKTKLGRVNEYHLAIWKQKKPQQEYFNELFRVSKNQIVWGANYYITLIARDTAAWVVWDKRHQEGNPFADCELAWTSFNTAARIFRYRWNGMLQENMKNREKRIHPTQKPVDLYMWLIGRYAKDGDLILDTHVGSASSLIACHETNHKYVGFEIDPVYYTEAKKRLDAATAQMTIYDLIGVGGGST